MTYSVQNTDGSKTINVAASQVNSAFSIALVGRNVSGYGQYFVQNAIRHLENFASTSAPSDDQLLQGQLWYDKGEEVIRVYDGASWRRASITVSATAPTDGVESGTSYYDTVDDKLKVHDGTQFIDASYAGKVTNEFSNDVNLGSPSKYGTRLRTIFLVDYTGVHRAVLGLMYVSDGSDAGYTDGESIMAVFSDHAQFDISTTAPAKVEGLGDVNLYNQFNDSDGIGSTIRPGMNLRNKYAGTAVSLANSSIYADVSNAISTASGNVVGSKVFTASSTALIPDNTDVVPMGNTANRYSELFINDIEIGNPSSSSARYIKKSSATVLLDIGEQSAPVDNLYVDNIFIKDGGGITGLNIDTYGSNTALIDEIWSSEVYLDASGDKKFTDNGVYGLTIYDINGNPLVDPSAGAASTLGGDNTFSGNNTYSGDILSAGNHDIGSSSSRFGTLFVGTLDATVGDISGDLDVGGTVTATLFDGVASSAKYADLAEKYTADENYEAGTVVKIGGDAEMTQTTDHNDLDVFGVVSTTPAYLMNSEADGIAIAMTGRVPVRVVGKVKKGERLISSSVPGVAWAMSDEEYDPRAVIGRSLEDKNDGDIGTVEAVIGVK